jgi:hypothetical protein
MELVCASSIPRRITLADLVPTSSAFAEIPPPLAASSVRSGPLRVALGREGDVTALVAGGSGGLYGSGIRVFDVGTGGSDDGLLGGLLGYPGGGLGSVRRLPGLLGGLLSGLGTRRSILLDGQLGGVRRLSGFFGGLLGDPGDLLGGLLGFGAAVGGLPWTRVGPLARVWRVAPCDVK